MCYHSGCNIRATEAQIDTHVKHGIERYERKACNFYNFSASQRRMHVYLPGASLSVTDYR